MRKSQGVSLLIACIIAALLMAFEHQRGRHFLAPRIEAAREVPTTPTKGFGFKVGRWMQRAEWSTSDLRFKIRGNRPPHPDVVIIAIDDRSLAELKEWPWPRSIHAKLIETLSVAPPKALLFDVLFLEPSTAAPDGDRALVKATLRHPWAVHSLFLNVTDNQITGGKVPFGDLAEVVDENVGSVNAFVDEDGVLRSAALTLEIDGERIPLLSLVGSSLYLGEPAEPLARRMPVDSRGEVLVQYAGSDHAFPYVPYVDVLTGKVPPSAFAGKVVLVGSNATGTYDHYPTPLSAVMPGVEFHANVIDNLLSGTPLRYAGLRLTYFCILVGALFCGLVLVHFSAGAGALWTLALLILFLGGSQYLFVARHILVDMAGPLMMLTFGYVAIVVYRFFTEEREKRWVKAAFGQYVSPKVLEVLMDDPSKLKLVGERREMTVFFSDVAGFTSISERMNPDELVVLLNRYLSAMTEVVFEYDGYLNKYMGDGIMAFWNAPVKQDDHAFRACRCALRSMTRLTELNKELAAAGIPELKARIGLNSGIMVVGNMGSQQKSDYTVMGDNVNLGSRLEGANKAFGSQIMISEFTYELVRDAFEVRFLDKIRVPGKAKPVKTYELLAEKGALPEAWGRALAPYHEGIELFANQAFQEAQTKFLEVIQILGQDKPSAAYLERIQAFLANPPAKDWDGVFELHTK